MIKSLEEKRKARSHAFFVKKIAHEKNMKKIQGQVFSKLTEVEQQILRAAGQC